MMKTTLVSVISCLMILTILSSSRNVYAESPQKDYMEKREHLMLSDQQNRIHEMSDLEIQADTKLEALKAEYLALPTHLFPPANLFYEFKEEYDSMKLLEVMDQLPKGGMLHAHLFAIDDYDMMIADSYDPKAWFYTGEENWDTPYGSIGWQMDSPGPGWENIVELRESCANPDSLDKAIYDWITIDLDDYAKGDVWVEFEKCWSRIWRFVNCPDNRVKYITESCKVLAQQNTQYAEFRTYVGPNEYNNGKIISTEEVIEQWRQIRKNVQKEYPDFDFRLIATRGRWTPPEVIGDYLKEVADYIQKYPDLIIGFDWVGEEDKNRANLAYVDEWLKADKYAESIGVELTPYLHSGESDRLDNENLYDAILMDAKRIGHGFALKRHPAVMDQVVEKRICLEICPLSNQVLGYVRDLRNHPAVEYLVRDVPFIIAPDDPGMLNYRWSHDWVAATLAWDLSIGEIREIILNSFRYSGLDEASKDKMIDQWEKDWEKFLKWVITVQ